MEIIRIYLKSHLVAFLRARYASDDNVIKFDEQDDLYHVMLNLTIKRPADAPLDSGNVSIALPHPRVGKRPEVYNYLSERSVRAFQTKVERLFWAEIHDWLDEQKHRYGIDFTTAVAVFMERNGIEGISEDAIVKNYYRWRSRVRSKDRKREYKRP